MSDAPLVPHFIIGGAPRSGTTSLALVLDAHPQVEMAKPLRPEPKVFLREADGPDAYRERYRAYFGPEHAGLVRGEKSTNYLESEVARAALARTLPEVRLVFAVREPVERAHSNWRWSRHNGLETLPFAEAVEQEGQRPDPLPDRPHARPFDYLARSDYGRLARAWFDALGRDRVAFFLYEDLVGERAPDALRAVQEFIGVEPRVLPCLPTGLDNETRDEAVALEPALRERLRERLRPTVDDFASVTGLDVTPWGYA